MIEKRQIIDLVRQLPTIPQSLLELQQVLAQSDATVEQLKRVISADSALTANVLRLANSAAFGLSRKVADVSQAITLIGFKVLGNQYYKQHIPIVSMLVNFQLFGKT